MCKLKSCIVLKDRVFCPDYDSHSDMLEELGIKDTLRDAETKFVRVELLPEDEDIFSPVDKWEMKVDQDILPVLGGHGKDAADTLLQELQKRLRRYPPGQELRAGHHWTQGSVRVRGVQEAGKVIP